ncbi:hypothetical protein ACJIZ3_022841 [Penstemon smallii]|uniref:AT3G52170-like helix-turn-helix domain-containing protein n=1 Tax=Penstemon smallii TaxID=265156 RepID=A0ABD3TMI3_9LAMI
MHAIKGGWAGHAFAVAASSNDSGGKKSRIRRSKEERKSMVESFIKKYQKTNDGSFPSLNLTHKEVGGSFYTVREIVREIIQENRVLAPPKISLEEYDDSGFLEQHPLGSISMEPQSEFPVTDRIHIMTPILPNEHQITTQEHSRVQFHGLDPLELDNEQIVKRLSKVSDKDEDSIKENISHPALNHFEDGITEEVSSSSDQLPQAKSNEFENEKIVDGPKIHSLIDEKYVNGNDSRGDKTNEFGQQIHVESLVMESLDREKDGPKEADALQAVISNMNSNVVVETFPLRPVSTTIHEINGESGKLLEADGTFKDKAIQQDKMPFVQSSSDFFIKEDDKKLSDSTADLNGQYEEDKVELNLEDPSLESSKSCITSEHTLLDAVDIKNLESEELLPVGTKVEDSTKDSTAVRMKLSDQDKSSVPVGSNPMLDRINLETWERASKKSTTQPETNPLVAAVKAFISAFVKFWTE